MAAYASSQSLSLLSIGICGTLNRALEGPPFALVSLRSFHVVACSWNCARHEHPTSMAIWSNAGIFMLSSAGIFLTCCEKISRMAHQSSRESHIK